MNAERLLAHYERIADAADAIARLRRFILDLAVRAKLVPQDCSDEPASELLHRISNEKARLVQAGELGKPRDLDDGRPPKEPFPIPATWRWVRLDAVGAIVGGGTPSATDADNFAEPGEGVPWLTPADLGGYSDLYISRGARDLSEKGSRTSSATLMPKGTVLFTSRAPIGYVAVAANPISTNQGFKSIVPYVADCSRFIATAMRAFAPEIDAMAPGTTFKEVSGKIVAAIPFPLPPLAEQRRIVAKVDELMILCDRLEAARVAREATRDSLAAASLARLNAPDPNPVAFADHARFVLDVLPALTTRRSQIKQLRQTVLNLAVRGKLVPQDPNDEPASELLAKKAKLPNGYRRRRKILKKTSVEVPDYLFPLLPASWCYTDVQTLYDLNAITDYADGNHGSLYPRSSEFGGSGVTFVTARDLVNGRVVWDSCSKLNHERAQQLTKGWAQGGDILLTHNATVGRVARVEPSVGRFLLGTSVTFYRLNSEVIDPTYFFVVLRSPLWQGQLEAIMAQTTRNQVSIQKQAFFRVAVPPLAEQRRIVAKVDELMALCDRLEVSLTIGDDTRRRLLDALLHEALAPGESLVPEETKSVAAHG